MACGLPLILEGRSRCGSLQTSAGLTATTIEATNNVAIPVGKVLIKNSGPFSNPLAAEEVCAYPGYKQVFWVRVELQLIDENQFVESLAPGQACGGFPLTWTRVTEAKD